MLQAACDNLWYLLDSRWRRTLRLPMHRAVLDDAHDTLERLLQARGDIHQRNGYGFTALEMARFLGRSRCEELITGGVDRPLIPVINRDSSAVVIYSCDDFEELMGITWIPTVQFADVATFRSAVSQGPWLLKHGEPGREARWLGKFQGKELSDGGYPSVSIRWIDETLGYGLFAEEDIASGAFVGEYAGVVKRRPRFREHNPYCVHYPTSPWWPKVFMIDAEKKGNFSRYINHSDIPNLKWMCLVNNGMLRVTLHASQGISVAEQLTVDYGDAFWRRRIKVTNR